MGDTRYRILKDLINSFCFLEQNMKFQMQCIESEESALRQSTENWEPVHTTFERLGNLEDLECLWNEYQRQQKKTLSTIQTFLDFNPNLQGTKYYLEATKLIQEQKTLEPMKGQSDRGNLTLAATEKAVKGVDSQHADRKLSKAE